MIRTLLGALTSVTVVAVLLVPSAVSAQNYSDPCCDLPGSKAPDITEIDVADSAGILEFIVRTANYPALGPDLEWRVLIDSDRNPATGSTSPRSGGPGAGGLDYYIEQLGTGAANTYRWNGSTFVPLGPPLTSSYSAGVWRSSVRLSDVSPTSGLFNFRVETSWFNPSSLPGFIDYAPDAVPIPGFPCCFEVRLFSYALQPPSPPPPPTVLKAVVLGDSYSSGEGTYSYGEGEKCHRSPLAWGRVVDTLSTQLELVANLACSGAKISHVLNEDYRGEKLPQVEQLRKIAANQQIDIVLLTIGGNDLNFGGVLWRCGLKNGPLNDCIGDLDWMASKSAQVANTISDSVIPAIQSASGATVAIVGYPRIFAETPPQSTGCGWLSGGEQLAANNAGRAMTTNWRAAAARSGALFVDSYDAFDGRELCTEPFSWFNPLFTSSNFSEQGHPTIAGYSGWGQWIYAKLRSLGLNIG